MHFPFSLSRIIMSGLFIIIIIIIIIIICVIIIMVMITYSRYSIGPFP
jgi:hypothetical protein